MYITKLDEERIKVVVVQLHALKKIVEENPFAYSGFFTTTLDSAIERMEIIVRSVKNDN